MGLSPAHTMHGSNRIHSSAWKAFSRKYVRLFWCQDGPYRNHLFVFGSCFSGIRIQEVRLCIRGSAIVPTILFSLSRAPKKVSIP